MSQLAPFIRAFRSLGTALNDHSSKVSSTIHEVSDRANVEERVARVNLLANIGDACLAAATDLEQQIAADLARLNRADAEQVTPR